MKKIFFKENKNGIGVQINDLDLGYGLSTSNVNQIQELLNLYRVVVFRNQALSDDNLKAFANRLGPLFVPDSNSPVLGSKDSAGSIVVVGNQAHEYSKSYLGHQEVLPHSDHQWLQRPSAASMLYAVDIAPVSSPTIWTDMVMAYKRLDENTRKAIHELKMITYNPFFRPFGSVNAKYVNRFLDIPPGETFPHPLVRTHPVTKEKILYFNLAYEMEIIGVSFEEGFKIYSLLQQHVKKLDDYYEHHWQTGDLVLWDNRATIHYRPAFDSQIRRVLKRLTIAGETPY